MQYHNDLNALISQDEDARQYYDSLPAYVREMVSARGKEMSSFDSLKRYAENLLIGD